MSGGVDSSTAAALLVERGYEVIGIMMRLWAEGVNRCCSPEAVEDARRVCSILGIPFYLVNYEREFKHYVVDYFIREYSNGRTPNPCLACNRYIKFSRLLEMALALEANYLATGHYARVRRLDGSYQLLRGVDKQKDQSYFLYMLGQKELSHILFPLGDYTKREVREIAMERGLPVAEKPESQDLCFVLDGDYRRFLRDHAPGAIKPGPIVDTSGRVLGEHKGLAFYTIGQRRGLGIAAREPLYVLEVDAKRNAIVVGTKAELGKRELLATDVNFVSGKPPEGPIEVTAKIRYKAVEVPAILKPIGSEVILTFPRPLRDITPGQGVVFYQGDVVLGGGIIERREEYGTNLYGP
jgi:tRNA-specific 2-thiouridylase